MNSPALAPYLECLRQLAADVREPAGGLGWRYYHTLRVVDNALRIAVLPGVVAAASTPIERHSLAIGAIFHDLDFIVRVPKDRLFEYSATTYPRHGICGAELLEHHVEDLLAQDPNANIPLIKAIITGHCLRKEGNPDEKTIEERICADADNLEKVGLLMFWRSSVYTGFKHRSITSFNDYATDELPKTIEQNLERFFFPEVRNIAESRYARMQATLEAFRVELNGADIL